ncbi:MAG: DUF6675 family protein [Treponema sp.]|nr:DUF6675 family protein [Treponema sp.]
MKKILFVLSCLFMAFSVSAQNNLESYVNSKYINALKNYGKVSVIHEKNDNVITMVPECEFSDAIKADLISANGEGVPFLAEFIYLIPKKDLTDDVSKVNIDSISVLFRSISKMQGMKYIHNGGRSDVLYSKSYAIASVDSFAPVADPVEGQADGLVIYAYQHDHTFGDTKYKLTYRQKDNVLWSNFLSQIPMGMLGVKAVMAENMETNVLCIDVGDALLLYLNADVNAKKLVGIRGQIEDSMTVRMDAIYKWFMQQFK